MNEQMLLAALDNVMQSQSKTPEWKEDLMTARIEIVIKLLTASYYALGINVPSEEDIRIRASQIAEYADISNRMLKAAFDKALSIKMEKDLRTPITYGDINRAAIAIAENDGITIVGKWKNALPNVEDKSLWGEAVIEFAYKHGKNEFLTLTGRSLPNA